MVSFHGDDIAAGASLGEQDERSLTASSEMREFSADVAASPVPTSLSKLSAPGIRFSKPCMNGCKVTAVDDVNFEFGAGSSMLRNMRNSLSSLLQQQEECRAKVLSLIGYMDAMGTSSQKTEETFDIMNMASQEPQSTNSAWDKGDVEAGNGESLENQVLVDALQSSSLVSIDTSIKPERSVVSAGVLKIRSNKKLARKTLRLSGALKAARRSIELRSTSKLELEEEAPCRAACRSVLESPKFDYFIGFIILVNSICVGIETQLALESESANKWPQEVDSAFVCIYTVEIVIRVFAYGAKQLRDAWFIFDLVLVSMGILSNLLLPLCIALSVFSDKPRFLDPVLVIRSIRLLRFLRAVRMLKQFRIIWRLVYGLLTSMNTMLSTLVLLALTLYVFACLGVEIISKDSQLQAHEDTALVIEYHFSSLPATLLTFMQFISLDSCAAIYSPLVKRNPVLIIYFLAVMLVVPIALMNLVTAVLVEGALENAEADKQQIKNEMHEVLINALPRLEQIFQNMDDDGDGMVSRTELRDVPIDMLPKDLFDPSSHVGSMDELFSMLDVEQRGWMMKDEFLDGLISIFVLNVPIETIQILKMLYMISEQLQNGVAELKTKPVSLDDERRPQ